MGAIEAALRRKEEVKRYYEDSAATGLSEASEIFTLLAQDEERHWMAMCALGTGLPARLEPSPTVCRARNLLRRLSILDAASGAHHELDVYFRAMDMEAVSAGAYSELAKAHSGWKKDLFLGIAAEEEVHFTLLEELRELLFTALKGEGSEVGDVV